METMHAAGRRNLPPVPRPHVESDRVPAADRTADMRGQEETPVTASASDDFETAAFDPLEIDLDDDRGDDRDDVDLTTGDATRAGAAPSVAPAAARSEGAATGQPVEAIDTDDPAQQFVSRLRAAAADFAAAAGAESAVVREAVPPARHRRSRCRLVLRYRGGDEADLTFLGSVGRPGTPAWLGFDQQIQRWLGNGQHREAAWLVEDPEASDGVAVDVPAWLAAS
jgi:hypothetical protein